jgi:hypothetical protein
VRVAFRVDKAPGGPRFRSRCAGSIVGVMQVAVVIISLLPMPTTLEPACCMLSAQEPETTCHVNLILGLQSASYSEPLRVSIRHVETRSIVRGARYTKRFWQWRKRRDPGYSAAVRAGRAVLTGFRKACR